MLCVMCVSAGCLAADPVRLPSSEYQLSIDSPDAFRLARKKTAPTVVEPRRESAATERLAGRPYAKLIEGAAREASLDPALVHAVISVESGYNQDARSPKGAIGLMQVLPETASRYGVRNPAQSPEANIRAGTLYLSDLMQMFDSRIDLVLAAYNAGENAVIRYGQRIPPYRETRQYVPAVLARYLEWREPPPPPVVVLPTLSPRIEYMPGTVLNPDVLPSGAQR